MWTIEGVAIQQAWPMPVRPRPIVLVGAGGIAADAHLPAYRKAGFRVAGITDRVGERAEKLAARFDIPAVFKTVEEAVGGAPSDAVWDVAVIPSESANVLRKLPDGAAVLVQKPMGNNWEETRTILEVCRQKRLAAAINCQLRFAPYVLAARSMIDAGLIGELHQMEVRLTVSTPWEIFPYLRGLPRVEIQQHSIHYIDLIRSFLGEPRGVYCRTVKHPRHADLASTRTAIIFDYGDDKQVQVSTNHGHEFGAHNQESFIKWEGTRGAIKARMGLLMNYPHGSADLFEYCLLRGSEPPQWRTEALEGTWFPDAFAGTMANVQRFATGEDDRLLTSVEDVARTMRVVEACHRSSETGGTSVE